MLKWFICLFRRHQWHTWYDKKWRRNRTVCGRCGAEKAKLLDSSINPNYFM